MARRMGQGTVGNGIWENSVARMMGSWDCGERDMGKYCGENDGVRVLRGTGYGENTVARMMGSGDCGERDMGKILWRE